MGSEFEGQTAGIYPRVSTLKQAESGRTSLEDQKQACRDYARTVGMIVDEECVSHEQYTSTKMSRPELNELLRKMQERKVPNLIIDRVDRMTRAGQLAAVQFLQQFSRAGITLHIVSMAHEDSDDDDDDDGRGRSERALVIRKHDDKAVKDFLDAAYAAQEDNKKRVRIVRRAKRSRAQDGLYLRGSRAPYGFKYVACEWDHNGIVTDYRMDPDLEPFTERGWPQAALFAPNPYEARKRMLVLYADGYSFAGIAARLTRDGVPSATQLTPRQGHIPKVWSAKSARYLVLSKLNEGRLLNFRQRNVIADLDKRHDEEWVRQVPVPLDKQIPVNPRHGTPAPLMDEQTAALIALRREDRNRGSRPATPPAYGEGALLVGGRGKCVCGGNLHISRTTRRGRVYNYYRCTRSRDIQGLSCVRWSMRRDTGDEAAWTELLHALYKLDASGDNYLDILAEKQSQDETAAPRINDVAALESVRAQLQRQFDDYRADLRLATRDTTRAALIADMDKLSDAIEEADRKIAARKVQAARVEEHRAVFNSYLNQYHRYLDALDRLDLRNDEHIPLMIEVARRVGARWTRTPPDEPWETEIVPARPAHPERTLHYPALPHLGQAEHSVTYLAQPEIPQRTIQVPPPPFRVHLLISPAAAQPWFTDEQEHSLEELDRLPERYVGLFGDDVVESSTPDVNPGDSKRLPFGRSDSAR